MISTLKVYPNPFSDRLNIEFVPVADANAFIEIIDMTGRTISILFESQVKAGVQYKVVFKPENINPGIYFYRMKTGETITTGKLLYNH